MIFMKKLCDMYKNFFKRLIDFIIVFNVLLVIWPVLLVITLWLHFANKGAGAFFFLLPDAERLTNVGRFVRSTSIDELPQLILQSA